MIAVRLLEPSIRAASPPDFSWTGSRECRLLPRSGRCDGAAACQGGAIRVACRGDFPAKGCRGATSIQLPSRISPNLFSLSVVWRTFHALPSICVRVSIVRIFESIDIGRCGRVALPFSATVIEPIAKAVANVSKDARGALCHRFVQVDDDIQRQRRADCLCVVEGAKDGLGHAPVDVGGRPIPIVVFGCFRATYTKRAWRGRC